MTYLIAHRRAAGWASILALAVVACSNSEDTSDLNASTNGLTTGTGTAEGSESPTESGEQGDGDGDSGQDDGPILDLGDPGDPDCDVWAQDCPADQKCSWEIIDAVPQPACVPLLPDAVAPGAPCMVFGDPGSGHDDCALGAMCSWLDGDNAGVCLALCAGSPAEPNCEAAELPAVCLPCTECPSLCVPTCDPLAGDCGLGYACTPNAGTFTCMPAENLGDGALGDPCEYSVQCQEGFGCIDGLAVPGCEGAGCCSPFCSLELPACPNGMSCAPWFEGDMPPVPDVGVCVLR